MTDAMGKDSNGEIPDTSKTEKPQSGQGLVQADDKDKKPAVDPADDDPFDNGNFPV